MRFVLAATAAICLYLVVCSIGTLPILGDDSQHFRRANVFYETGFPAHRIDHDSAYPAEGYIAIRYFDGSLWHMGLALVWRVLGHPSLLAAQVYQALFYFFLMFFAYLIGRELYGRRAGLWAWFIMATLPMHLLFGMLFYLEVPVLAFVAATVYCLIRRYPVLMGLAAAGMFLTKVPTAFALTPPLLAASLLMMGRSWRGRALRTGAAVLVCLVVMLPDMLWRLDHFGRLIMVYATTAEFHMKLQCDPPPLKQPAIPWNVTDLWVDLQMLGLAGGLAIVTGIMLAAGILGRTLVNAARHLRSAGFLASVRRLPELGSDELLVLGIPLIFYIGVCFRMLGGAYDVRYLLPCALFAVILSGGLLARLRPFSWHGRRRSLGRIAAGLLVLSMAAQGVAVPLYIHGVRQLPEEVTRAFEWIRGNAAPRSRILYLEANLVTLTGRPVIWAAALPNYIFAVPEQEQMRLLYYLGVEYIAIHPTRQCDWEPGTVPMAHPREWVRSLAARPYLVRVYPPGSPETLDGRFLIYRIDPSKVPQGWLADVTPEEGDP